MSSFVYNMYMCACVQTRAYTQHPLPVPPHPHNNPQSPPATLTHTHTHTTRFEKQEGVKGLFSGAVPRTLYIGPSTALFFVAYGAVRSYIHRSPALAASWEQ